VKFFLEIDGANLEAIIALVIAGFPTTHTFTDFLAYLSKNCPYSLNILALSLSKSALSIPFYLGFAPTNKAISASSKAFPSPSVQYFTEETQSY